MTSDEISINKAVNDFIHNLDSLREALDPVMLISSMIRKSASDEHLKNLEKYGELSKEEDGIKTFNIPAKHIRKIERKRKRSERTESAIRLLPKKFLISFVSEFDGYISNLVTACLKLRPEILNRSDKSLTYEVLMRFASINDALDYIIEKEVEDILRKSHAEQFKWMKNTFDIELQKNLENWPIFIELTERRNLFVHADGHVSTQYLSVCENNNVATDSKIGDILDADKDYLINSYKCLYEFGIKLSQVLWRKLVPSEIEKADQNLNEFAYELLVQEKYDLATRLLEFAVKTLPRWSSEKFKRMFIMNLAQAYRFSNRDQDCDKLLDDNDWSACGDDFRICYFVLKNDHENASQLMKKIGKSELIAEESYLEWPIFKKFRETDLFIETYKDIYGYEPVGHEIHTSPTSTFGGKS